MKHQDTGVLRAWLDGQMQSEKASALGDHIAGCVECQAELNVLKTRATSVRAGLDVLPQPAAAGVATWTVLQQRLEHSDRRPRIQWNPLRIWSLAGACAVVIAVVLMFTVAPVRAWAESLLAIFRVEHFTVLELNPDAMKAKSPQNEQVLNQDLERIFSDEVTVTESPRAPQPVADAATATKLAGFNVHLIAGEKPAFLAYRSAATAQMKLDRDRLQSVLDEAGRGDLQIPQSVDGAVIGVLVPAGIMALYGNCGDRATRWQRQNKPGAPEQPGDATCVTLMELPSPTVSAPQEIDPGQIAQVALQFAGMSANEAASFTQTVDWTSTLVLPILQGQSSYEKVAVGGAEGVLLRPKGPAPTGRFNLLWVDNGIVYSLAGSGDDAAALKVASQIE